MKNLDYSYGERIKIHRYSIIYITYTTINSKSTTIALELDLKTYIKYI